MSVNTENSLIKGNIILGDLVHIKDGIILDNPFSRSISSSECAKWMVDNAQLAKYKIREEMKINFLGVHEVDECFDYAIYFFLEKEGRDFDSGYFGDEASETYTIDIYCLRKISHIVYEYRNEMRKRLKKNLNLIDMDKDSSESMPKDCISFDILSKASFEEEKEGYGFNEVVEFQELQEMLDIELPYYNEDFRVQGMNNFDIRSYVYHLFLSDEIVEMEGSKIKDESLARIADNMGITKSALKKQTKIVKELMKNRKDLFEDVPEIMARMVKGKMSGWKPVY